MAIRPVYTRGDGPKFQRRADAITGITAPTHIDGLDLSEFNLVDGWQALRSNADFLMIRSGDGMVRQDHVHHSYVAYARAFGFAVGHTHVFRVDQGQMAHFAEAVAVSVGPLPQGEPVALDIEDNRDCVVEAVAECADRLKQLLGFPPLIYMNRSMLRGNDWTPLLNLDCGLWLATLDRPADVPGEFAPWPVLAIHQWGQRNDILGVTGLVDCDRFFGDVDTFKRYGAS